MASQGIRKPITHGYVGMPTNEDGDLDRDALEKEFMASEFIDWTRFCEGKGYDATYSRRSLPVQTWQEKKRRIIAENEADKLSAILFERKFKWHNDVIKTLNEYPQSIDLMHTLVRAKQQEYAELWKDFVNTPKDQRKKHPWSAIKSGELAMLAKAQKDCTDAKYKSLLLDKWTVEKADEATTPIELESQDKKEFKFNVIGHPDGLAISDLQKMMDEYLDKPQGDVIDVEPE